MASNNMKYNRNLNEANLYFDTRTIERLAREAKRNNKQYNKQYKKSTKKFTKRYPGVDNYEFEY